MPRQSNRAHGAIDKLGPEVQSLIKDEYIAGRTYEEISRLLKDEGYEISRSQVHRWIARHRNEIVRIEQAIEQAKVLAKYFIPEGADVESAAVQLAQSIIFEALMNATLQGVRSIDDFAKVAQSLGRLQSSAVARDKWEHGKARLIDKAMEELKALTREEITDDPELVERLLAAMDRSADRMKQKT